MTKLKWDKAGNIIIPTPKMPAMRIPHQKYWYIVCKLRGKNFVDGPHVSEAEARDWANTHLRGVVWELVEAKTRVQALFNQRRKHQLLEDGDEPEEAVSRMRHKL